MPLQNRVTPTGEIVADPGRGLLMGNRGCLHRPDRTLGTARWRSRAWICCLLEWKDVRRDPMPPGRWTALFFLDEATALAAGHRPCAACRRPDYLRFRDAFGAPRAPALDARLHAERLDPRPRAALAGELPDGAMIRHRGAVGLWLGGAFRPWSFAGYGAPLALAPPAPVELITPPATVAALRAGYAPMLHPSAHATVAA